MIAKQSGFTLLELLVSLAIFAVIYMIAHGTLVNIISGSQAVTAEQEKWQQLDIAFAQMQEDLNFASERRVRDTSGFVLSAFKGQQTDTRAVAPPSLEFSRAGIRVLSGDRETGNRRIAYRLKDGVLYREIWPTLDRKYDAKPIDDRLVADVTRFDVRFLGREGQWLGAWPDNRHPTEILPVAVDITINTRDGDPVNRIFLVNG
jgi:general secretion pathway protein J